jgi:hypothetical protein
MKKIKLTIIISLLVSVSLALPTSAADIWTKNETQTENRYTSPPPPHEISGFGTTDFNQGVNRIGEGTSGNPNEDDDFALGERDTFLKDSLGFFLLLGLGYGLYVSLRKRADQPGQ